MVSIAPEFLGRVRARFSPRPPPVEPVTPRVIPPEVIATARAAAAVQGVGHRIHPADYIFWAIYDAAGGDAERAVAEYFEIGRSTAQRIAVELAPFLPASGPKVLDFAGGYGRLTRQLAAVVPNVRMTLSDIHPEAVTFARELGFAAKASTWRPRSFRPGRFDATVAISFFTHMPRETWTDWLEALGRSLSPNGVLLFTTHGQPALTPMGITDVEADGFGFFQQSEQKDLRLEDYASTVTLPPFVREQIERTNLQLVSHQEGGFGYQDLWIVRR